MVRATFRAALALTLGLPTFAWASRTLPVVRACKVWNEPVEEGNAAQRQLLGELKAGEMVEVFKIAKKGFVQMGYGRGRAYILRSCFQATPAHKKRTVSSLLYSAYSGEELRFGVAASFDSNLARASSADGLGTDFGYGIGLVAFFPLGRFRLAVSPLYRSITLTRQVTFTGGISSSPATNISQRVTFIGLQTILAFNLMKTTGVTTPLEWWLEGGAEFLYPLGGEQTNAGGSVQSFDPPDKPLLALFGGSGFYHFENGLGAALTLHGFYNIAATAGNSLLGGRLGLSISFPL